VMLEMLRRSTAELTSALGEACGYLVMTEQLPCPTPEVPCTLQDV